MTITLLISIKKIQICFSIQAPNVFFRNIQAASKNSLPFKSYRRRGERMSHFNTFSKRLRLVNNLLLTYFLSKILIQDY